MSDDVANDTAARRSSDIKSDLEAIQLIDQLNKADEADLPETKKALEILESPAFNIDFAEKIGEIKNENDEPLHVFKQNVRMYQDKDTNMFIPRLAEFSIQIKEKFAEKDPEMEGQPGQEIITLSYVNLA